MPRLAVGQRIADVCQGVASKTIEMVGFPTDEEKILAWLQESCGFASSLTLESLAKLKQLDLSDKGLVEVPKEIGCLRDLKFLDLSYNFISSTLPKEIGRIWSGCILMAI